MEKSLFRFIWKNSARYQITILLITCLSYPVSFMLLDLPKQITNDAIQGTAFPREVMGVELDQIEYLAFLCFLFLFLVVVSNGIKLFLNVYKGRLGERMLRRLRFDLYQRVLRFRLPHFRKVSSGEIIPMITAEVEDVGGFIGEAIALPAYQGGMLVVQLGFIFLQDPLLGLAAISSYPIQAYIIPKLQKKVVLLSRERVRNVRVISDKIGESIGGVTEIHANDASAWHSADLSDRLYKNFRIRFDIYNRKYFIKFVNNFMNQLTPFFFYLIGGYLVIKGELSIGALIAVIAAYKDLAAPWKELLAYYQMTADVNVKYQTVVENFDPQDIYPLERIKGEESFNLDGDLVMTNATFAGGSSGQEVFGINLTAKSGKTFAVIGVDGSGRTEVLQMAAGLLSPTAGRVEIGTHNLEGLCEATLGRQIAYVGGSVHVWTGTIRDNLYYGLRNRPLDEPSKEHASSSEYRRWMEEARATANPEYSLDVNWLDYDRAGAKDTEELDNRVLEIIEVLGLSKDLYRLGLQSVIDPEHDAELVQRILDARHVLAGKVQTDPKLRNLVELWDIDTFNASASLAENLFFAVPKDSSLQLEDVLKNKRAVKFLEDTGLDERLVEIGKQIAEIMIELFSDVSGDSELLDTYSFIKQEDLPEFERILRQMKAGKLPKKTRIADRNRMINLAFKLVPSKHRLGVMDDALQEEFVKRRKEFRDRVGAENDVITFFDNDTYMPTLTIEDNLLFGRPRLDRRDARQRIDEVVRELVMELGLRQPVRRAGLDYHVGVAGSRLSAHQRRMICVARALMKSAPITILDDTIAGVTETDRELRNGIRKLLEGRTLIFGSTNVPVKDEFDAYILLENGRVSSFS
ncbi:ABC transporter transmembrane domain-containing protein [Pseudovibrio exalbescens]|uniref:ATP-binding cassette domain-containing protein n=1 Tax=Pseudovibrio exalbescens TaxID=197461 RepID=UPI0023669A7F|nr:ABC transporter transmembrane domain-containing protein [Pseudovibrio exalbescens]MDD7909106.1 ABC transporter transmembrane domain-containing protein [Pseudovibrio exalbescens]